MNANDQNERDDLEQALERELSAEGQRVRAASDGDDPLVKRIQAAVRREAAEGAGSDARVSRFGHFGIAAMAAGLLLGFSLLVWWAWPAGPQTPAVVNNHGGRILGMLSVPQEQLRPDRMIRQSAGVGESFGYEMIDREWAALTDSAAEAADYLLTFLPQSAATKTEPASQPG